ncbi:GNAT family N-acetyltransferase [Cellulomonas bogoriensis]|nr:GNAT family N-acetyltransferase [Cellulomonas bogoriensis]
MSRSAGRAADGAPTPDEVEDLYAAATQGPPLCEPRTQAAAYASVFSYVLARGDAAWVAARSDGALVGIAYGHPWEWAHQTDEWSAELKERLGAAAHRLEDSFAVYLLAVHPTVQRAGLGRVLLEDLLATAGARRAWLQTRDEETPARALYRAGGWTEVGHGPDAPNGRPGLVLGLRLREAAPR